MKVSDARLIAGDAGANLFGSSTPGFVRQFGVADQCARHRTHIRLAGDQNGFRILRLVDSARDENRYVHSSFDAGGIRSDVRWTRRHRRRNVNGPAQTRGVAQGNVDVIDAAGHAHDRLLALSQSQALLVPFRSGDP